MRPSGGGGEEWTWAGKKVDLAKFDSQEKGSAGLGGLGAQH